MAMQLSKTASTPLWLRYFVTYDGVGDGRGSISNATLLADCVKDQPLYDKWNVSGLTSADLAAYFGPDSALDIVGIPVEVIDAWAIGLDVDGEGRPFIFFGKANGAAQGGAFIVIGLVHTIVR